MAATKTLYAVLSWANEAGVELDELTLTRPSLEDVYLRLLDAQEPEDKAPV